MDRARRSGRGAEDRGRRGHRRIGGRRGHRGIHRRRDHRGIHRRRDHRGIHRRDHHRRIGGRHPRRDPYQQVTDHRTELKTSAVQAVLDGDLDGLIEAYLLMQGGMSKKAEA